MARKRVVEVTILNIASTSYGNGIVKGHDFIVHTLIQASKTENGLDQDSGFGGVYAICNRTIVLEVDVGMNGSQVSHYFRVFVGNKVVGNYPDFYASLSCLN